MHFKVISVTKNTKKWERIKKNLLRGSGRVNEIGWWGSRHPSGVPTAQVAKWNEEGHVNGGMFAGTYTPPRPFIRVGFMGSVPKIVKMHLINVNSIALGKSSWLRFNRALSKDLVQEMQKTILTWNTPSNTPTTIKLKGFNDPLIETGNMYDAVKSRITKRGL